MYMILDLVDLGDSRRCTLSALLENGTVALADNTVYVQIDVCEPTMLSPFIFGSGNGKQGFYDIQTMNFQMNMAPTAKRAWCCARVPDVSTSYSKEVSVERFEDSLLHFQYLTPHPSDLRMPRKRRSLL